MALDGITISGIITELKENILGGRIDKVYQPESDEVILQIRCFGKTKKLLLTANASNPRIHFSEISKENPATPPLFCMVLRKHLASGKIIRITQPNFERIINITVESINELGDYSEKTLIIEIMGRHSNIILIDENETILDCAKHISFDKSSVRQVLPGKKYTLPPNQDKKNPLELKEDIFKNDLQSSKPTKVQEFIYKSYSGISPIMASEICFRANIDPSCNTEILKEEEILNLYNSFKTIIKNLNENNFCPQVIFEDNKKIIDFSVIELTQFLNKEKLNFETISKLLEYFYKERDLIYRTSQKTQDLKKIVTQNIERCIKKKEVYQKTLKEIANRDNLKLYGELITSNIYSISKGMTTVKLNNFYSENYEEIEIPLDANLTPAENAQKYFKKYNKEKRTFSALQIQIKQNEEQLEYLENVLNSLKTCFTEQDIKDVREELAEEGIIKKIRQNKKDKSNKKSKPLHFISSDNFHIYVGKNNKQNDELTLKFAKSQDIWLHTKNIAGSHVIIVTDGREVSETALEEASNLAAFYSKASTSSLVPVDYTLRKNIKKPNGAKLGMVIYETNKTIYVTPSEEKINKLTKVE